MTASFTPFPGTTTLGELLRAKLGPAPTTPLPYPRISVASGHYYEKASDFLHHEDDELAIAYVKTRAKDAVDLVAQMKWERSMAGVLRCTIYGQSILWDIGGGVLHAIDKPMYEIVDLKALRRDEADPEVVFSFQQVVAYLLARFW
jgi:hypothetical protein